jgi:hypothetical protein
MSEIVIFLKFETLRLRLVWRISIPVKNGVLIIENKKELNEIIILTRLLLSLVTIHILQLESNKITKKNSTLFILFYFFQKTQIIIIIIIKVSNGEWSATPNDAWG